MNQKPIWQQYGFSSEDEFFRRYPNAEKILLGGHTRAYDTSDPPPPSLMELFSDEKRGGQSRRMGKQEQIEINRINEMTGFGRDV